MAIITVMLGIVLMTAMSLAFSRWRIGERNALTRQRLELDRERLNHEHFVAESKVLNPPGPKDPEVIRIEADTEARIKIIEAEAAAKNRGKPSPLVSLDCPSCGVTFGITKEYEKRRRNYNDNFHCPNGHPQHFLKSEEPKD